MKTFITGADSIPFLPGTFAPEIDGVKEEEAAGARPAEIIRIAGSTSGPDTDWVAEEVPVALVYNGISHAVMMTTPTMLEDFAVGFSLAEGIVRSLDDIHDIEVTEGCRGGKNVNLTIASEAFWKLKEHRRSMTGRTGCGICGTESLDDAMRPTPVLPFTQTFDMEHYGRALEYLQKVETLGALTGSTHAAAWVHPDGSLAGGAEDVGRHVALDKLLGLRARRGWTDGALVIKWFRRLQCAGLRSSLRFQRPPRSPLTSRSAPALRSSPSAGARAPTSIRTPNALSASEAVRDAAKLFLTMNSFLPSRDFEDAGTLQTSSFFLSFIPLSEDMP